MRFAITHPMLGHPHHPALATGAGVVALARAAEAAGFDGYGFTDHPAPPQAWLDAGGHDALDPFVALGAVAVTTTTLRLIPNLIVLPYRNPFLVAKAGATLDALSDGRFVLSAGAGYLQGEFEALGVPHEQRGALVDEAVDAIRAAWAGDEVTVEGASFAARAITARPRPPVPPPIWIGGNSAAARQRVADRGDGWNPFPAPRGMARAVGTAALRTPDDLATAIADLRRRLDANGRDPAAVDVCFSCLAGGAPGDADFDAAAHLAGLEELAAIGVTWIQVAIPGDSPERALEAMARYGEQVIGRHRAVDG